MKLAAIYGNAHKGSTWNSAQLIIEELKSHMEVELTEITLPRDLPHFCVGCFSCFFKGEDKCPHAESVSPIAKALEEADVILMASPVYGLDVSGPMKTLIDHLCYQWLSHRPNAAMFGKIGLTVVTTAGAGVKHTTKTLRNNLKFWGVKRIFSFGMAVFACKWEEVPEKKMKKIKARTKKMAARTAKALRGLEKKHYPFFPKFMFFAMRSAMKKGGWNPKDRAHWEGMGWLQDKRPWKAE